MMNTSDILKIIRGQAKKITGSGKKPESQEANYKPQVIDGQAVEKDPLNLQYDDLQQLFRHQFPSVTRQLLGKRYSTVNKISKFVLPNGMEQAADELLELLADFASQLASTEGVLAATGSREISQLRADLGRSQRAGFALKEVNKAIAAVQGALSGVTGLLGATLDLPASVILPLKTIYEIGHSYGFELDDDEDQKAVYFALSKIDLGLIAEKQTLFFALRSLKSVFATGDISQVSAFLNSNYSVDQFKNYLTDASGQYKWSGLQHLNKVKVLRFTLPIIGGAIGVVYNLRLIEDIAQQADELFSKARQYVNTHENDADISILEAYAKQIELLEQQAQLIATASPLLTAPEQTASEQTVAEVQQQAEARINEATQNIAENDTISSVVVIEKTQQSSPVDVEQEVNEGLTELAEKALSTTETTQAEATPLESTLAVTSPEAESTSEAVESKTIESEAVEPEAVEPEAVSSETVKPVEEVVSADQNASTHGESIKPKRKVQAKTATATKTDTPKKAPTRRTRSPRTTPIKKS